MQKISVLLPSKWPEKREAFINNLKAVTDDFESLEICVCLDGDLPDWQHDNFRYTYREPTPYISRFFESAYRVSTGSWLFLANDDIEILTKGWDTIIRNQGLNDPWKLYHFQDSQFNQTFSCHPFTSREVWQAMDRKSLVFPNYKNMGCDTTIWDVMPSWRREYIPEIKLKHNRFCDDKKQFEIQEDYVYYNKLVNVREQVKQEIMANCYNTNHRVLVGLSTAEHIRRADFLPYYMSLEMPTGTVRSSVHGQSPAQNRNTLIKQALDYDCTHIFFMDDDMGTPPDTLMKLLNHNKDVVTALYLMRSFPHLAVVFDEAYESGYNRHMMLTPEIEGLVEITNCGLGACLIKTEVFKNLEKPWVRLGELVRDGWCDDIGLFNRIRAKGYKLYCDTDVRVGHMTQMMIWPSKVNGNWISEYKHEHGQVQLPQTQPDQIPKPVNLNPEEEKICSQDSQPELVKN